MNYLGLAAYVVNLSAIKILTSWRVAGVSLSSSGMDGR
jgi:hypothetical protein